MNKTEFYQKREALKAEMANLEGEAFEAKQRELDNLTREFNAETAMMQRSAVTPKASIGETLASQIREIVASKQAREISLAYLSTGSEDDKNNLRAGGAVVTTVNDLLPILEKGLVWSKVGMKVQTGVKGDLVWPYATTNVEVEERNEAGSLNDKDINFDKKTAVPYSSGITIKVTNEAIDEATFDLANFVQTQMGLAVQRYLNKKTFSPANWSGLAGPYKTNSSVSSLECTYANIKEKKALIAATGVDMSGFCYVCDNKTKAKLETTPKANGQGGFIMENGMIDGDPVYITEYTNAKADGTYESNKYYLELGCFNYLAANQHGAVRLTVDPVTLASTNETKFVLHTKWSLTNLATATAFAIFNLTDPATPTTKVEVVNTTAKPVNTKEVSA